MTAHDTGAQRLVDLYNEKWAIVKANAERPSTGPDRLMGTHVQAALEAGDRQDEACEEFRRKHYPTRAAVVVGAGAVYTRSATGRSVQLVFDPKAVR